MTQETTTRRKPRYLLGTFWLILSGLALYAGATGAGVAVLFLGLLMLAYSIYLYRGGRFGFIIW